MRKLGKRLAEYKRRWGVFGLLFPLLGFAAGVAIVLVCVYYGAGFDVFAWMASPKAAPIWFVLILIPLAFLIAWCGF